MLVLGIGIAIGFVFIANPQQAEKHPRPAATALLVEADSPAQGEFVATVEALGQVRPALEAALKSQVAGEIVQVANEFLPGGVFKQGELILQIDPEDYQLAVRKQRALLNRSKADYQLEQGRQDVARDELDILARTTGKKLANPALALRTPQLQQAEAELQEAEADLGVAELDLRRTQISAPFNALVTARNRTLGDKIALSESLATLVSTDEYWVDISVPVEDLRWLQIPVRPAPGVPVRLGSPARVVMDGGRGEQVGHLLKLTGSLDPQSRLARVLVRVADPLLLDRPAAASPSASASAPLSPLILGDYVRVILAGKSLGEVSRIPLTWLRPGNQVWVITDGGLELRPVNVVYEDRRFAYIDASLSATDRVVTSDITVPVAGMRLRLDSEAKEVTTDSPASLGELG